MFFISIIRKLNINIINEPGYKILFVFHIADFCLLSYFAIGRWRTFEKFCLRWNDFESNISTAFKEVGEDKDIFDVTITCGDEQIQAHKVILSACSPFFRTVLRNNRHEHPLLYLKGVTYNDNCIRA